MSMTVKSQPGTAKILRFSIGSSNTPIALQYDSSFLRPKQMLCINHVKTFPHIKSFTFKEKYSEQKEPLYFTHLWKSPHWSDVHENLCSGWYSRCNYVRQVSKRNFQRLRFYRGSNFSFSYRFLNGPYNSAALLRCLWCLQSTNADW